MSNNLIIKGKPSLPLDKFPEWQNDERMNALFAPFRKTSANVQDQLSKYEFWKRLINEYLKYNFKCTFSISELEQAFERNDRKPQCLSMVIKDMIRTGEIVSEEEFMKEVENTWGSWIVSVFIKQPVRRSFSFMKSYIVYDTVNQDYQFINLQNMKNLANLVLNSIDESSDNLVISFKDFINCCKVDNHILDDHTGKIVLTWLARTKKASYCQINRSKPDILVKVSKHEVQQISEVEIAIYSLTHCENSLFKEIENLEAKKEEAVLKAKMNLSNGLRQAAKSWLRKKAEIEKNIESRANSLINVQKLTAKIHDAKSNTEVMEGYKTAYDVLKKFEKSGLTEETVKETVDNLAEVTEDFKEVESILTEPMESVSDLELEKELDILLKEQEEEKVKQEKESIPLELPDISKLNLKDLPLDARSTIQNEKSQALL